MVQAESGTSYDTEKNQNVRETKKKIRMVGRLGDKMGRYKAAQVGKRAGWGYEGLRKPF